MHACMHACMLTVHSMGAGPNGALLAAQCGAHFWQNAVVAMEHQTAEVDPVAVRHYDWAAHAAYVPACHALDGLQGYSCLL